VVKRSRRLWADVLAMTGGVGTNSNTALFPAGVGCLRALWPARLGAHLPFTKLATKEGRKPLSTSTSLARIIHEALDASGPRACCGRAFWRRRRRSDRGLRLRGRVCLGAYGPVAHGGNLATRPARSVKLAW